MGWLLIGLIIFKWLVGCLVGWLVSWFVCWGNGVFVCLFICCLGVS